MDSEEILFKYFPDLSIDQKEKFRALGSLYPQVNQNINLISRSDISHLYLRHVLHSLAISKTGFIQPWQSVLDLGTGGGFPGIPLSVMHPRTEFILVDSVQKKVNAVQSIISTLKISNVRVVCQRAEEMTIKVDMIVSRATASMRKLAEWSSPLIRPGNDGISGGLLALKGGDLDEELSDFTDEIEVFDISSFFDEDFFKTKKIVFLKL